MNRATDWIDQLLAEEVELLEWSACVPLAASGPTAFTLGGTLKFEKVDLAVEAELDVVLEEDGWQVNAIRLPQDHKWEDSTWNRPDHDVRASSDAKDRVPRIRAMARLNLYLLEAPYLGRSGYVSPLHGDGPVDFDAVGSGKLGEALQDVLRRVG
ncbi:hypothetical protein [Streptomyces sp. NPDC001594]|uniref:hypothetical protein n=1 Tax=Streptomyces sp. NPDC001594 TaxID=3364590 RepID=UPI0036C5BDA6